VVLSLRIHTIVLRPYGLGNPTSAQAESAKTFKRRVVMSASTSPSPLSLFLLFLSVSLSVASGAYAATATRSSAPLVARAPVRIASAGQAVEPSVFAPGACVAFRPLGRARHLTVFLDAGHGGLDPGAVGRTESGRTIHEAVETLAVALKALPILRRAGFRVVISRTRDSSVIRLGQGDASGGVLTVQGSHKDVVARDVCANDARASLLIGIYFNSGGPRRAGCLTAYDAVRPFAAENLRLARLVQRSVLAAMHAQGWRIPDAGVVSDASLGSAVGIQDERYGHLVLLGPAKAGYLSTPSRMPGALIEPLFISDRFEGTIASSAHGRQVIAAGLARAIEQYFAGSPR
jgi:N-acetylmuramoyl-L-alanine amidase